MRVEIRAALSRVLDPIPAGELSIGMGKCAEALATIADFAAVARSHVARDRNHEVRPEVGTRLVKELAKLAKALAIVHGNLEFSETEMRTIARVAEGCLPPNRLAMLRSLKKGYAPDLNCRHQRPDRSACPITSTQWVGT
jgi:hypothetical protein